LAEYIKIWKETAGIEDRKVPTFGGLSYCKCYSYQAQMSGIDNESVEDFQNGSS